MNILAIDTSSAVLSLALQTENQVVREKTHHGNWGHLEHCFPLLDELLRAEKKTISDVSLFLINRGPGSFTGLRIGFSILKGFLATKPRNVYGCDALTALAQRIPPQNDSSLAVCQDAFRGQFYIKLFSNQNGSWHPETESQAVAIEKAIAQIPAGTLVTGDALIRHKAVFEQAKPHAFSFAPEDLWFPRASAMLSAYQNSPHFFKKLVSSQDLLPTYLRLSEPEERKLEKR